MGYLVTGGTGLIGVYVTRLLLQEGEEVTLYDAEPRQDILDSFFADTARIGMVKGDITDLPLLILTVKEHRITKIVHMAGLLRVACAANPSLAVKINCEGTANVFEAARLFDVEKVVYASSNTVFGPPQKYGDRCISDDAPHYPTTLYGACKSFIERLAEHYLNAYGVDSVGLRFPIVYGMGYKGGAAAKLTEELMVKPASGIPGEVPFSPDDIVNWLHAEDAARASVMASRRAATKTKSFNITGEKCSVAAAVDYVKELIPNADITFSSAHIEFTGDYDTTGIREELNYTPKWPLKKGIEQVINEVRGMNTTRTV